MTDTQEKADNNLNHALHSIDAILVGMRDRYGPRNHDEAQAALALFTAEMIEGNANKLVWQQRTMAYGQLVASRILIDQNAHIMHLLAAIADALAKGFAGLDEGQRAGMALVADAVSAAFAEPEPPTSATPPATRPRLEVVKPAAEEERPKRASRAKAADTADKAADTADKPPKGGSDAP